MNSETCCQKSRCGAYVIGALGTFLIVAFLVRLMQANTAEPSVFAARSAERMKIRADFLTANAGYVDQTKYEWSDEAKGFVRIPVEEAMKLVIKEWQDPAAARSNLMARAAKEFAPAPKAPEPKNAYE
ncbi:MAG TPA: hypothetical protein VGO59_19945 [Verrucomicrobiae bacterium]|jgi:hypothetical protein